MNSPLVPSFQNLVNNHLYIEIFLTYIFIYSDQINFTYLYVFPVI
jgi:hypothetical protein